MPGRDFYKVLGVNRDASDEELKKGFVRPRAIRKPFCNALTVPALAATAS